MTPVEAFSATAAALSLIVAALSALAAFRSADSALAAQRFAEDAARRGALLSAARTAAEVLVEVQRIKSTAQQVNIAYDTLAVFSGSYQNSGIEQSKAKVAVLAAQAEKLGEHAHLFSEAGAKLRNAPPEEIDRVQLKLSAGQAEVVALREELEREAASIEAQNAQYRQKALSR